MLEQLISDEAWNFSKAFQILIKNIIASQKQGFQLVGNKSLSENQNLNANDRRDYCELNAPIELILQINYQDFIAAIQTLIVSEHKNKLSLVIAESILAQYYNPRDFQMLQEFQNFQNKLEQYVFLANSQLKSKDATHKDITNFDELLNVLSKSTDEVELMLHKRILSFSEERKKYLIAISDYAAQEVNIKSFITHLCNEKAISIVGALTFVLTKNLPYIFKSTTMSEEKILSDRPVILIDFISNKLSLLVNTYGYDFKNIWLTISKNKPTSLTLKALTQYSDKILTSDQNMTESLSLTTEPMDVDKLPSQDGLFGEIPVDITKNIIRYLLPNKLNYSKTYIASFGNLIRFGLTSKSLYQLITTFLNWSGLKAQMMYFKYGYATKVDNRKLENSIGSQKQASSDDASLIARYVQTTQSVSDITKYREFIREIKRKTLTDYITGIDDDKDRSYFYLTIAIYHYDRIEEKSDKRIKLNYNAIEGCLLYTLKAIENDNYTAWFLLHVLVTSNHETVRNLAVPRTYNQLGKRPIDVRDSCVKYFCESKVDIEVAKHNFTVLNINIKNSTEYRNIFFKNNFLKMNKIFILLYKKYGKITNFDPRLLLALYDCERPEKIINSLTLYELQYLVKFYLGRSILKLISGDIDIYTPVQLAKLVEFYLKALRVSESKIVDEVISKFDKYESISFSLLNQMILSPVGRIILNKFTARQINKLFNETGESLSSELLINSNHENILQLLSDPVIKESLLKSDGDILDILLFSSENKAGSISTLKFDVCGLKILGPTISLLNLCRFLEKASVSDLIYFHLNQQFVNNIADDREIIKRYGSSMSFEVLKQIYKSESATALFRKKGNLFDNIDNRILLLFITNTTQIDENSLLFVKSLSDAKDVSPDDHSMAERFKLLSEIKDKEVLNFFYQNPILFAPEFQLTDLEKITSDFIEVIRVLSEEEKELLLEKKNLLEFISSLPANNPVAFNDPNGNSTIISLNNNFITQLTAEILKETEAQLLKEKELEAENDKMEIVPTNIN